MSQRIHGSSFLFPGKVDRVTTTLKTRKKPLGMGFLPSPRI